MSESTDRDAAAEIERVSTLELFLDLVFVFTVTQLTDLVVHTHGGSGYAHAAVILVLTWWMYDGYVWLTGNVPLDRPSRRLVLFVGMGGFLLMAIAIPGAFGRTDDALSDTGILFGCAFLLVTLVHTGLFATAPNQSAQAIWRIAPFNLCGAVAVVATGFVDEDWRWIGWIVAITILYSSSLFGRNRGFAVSAAHFVERHGLVIIVALGESIVVIGIGASGLPIDAELIVTAMLGLALSATMWWVYFDGDDQLAEATMTAEQGDRRSRMGLSLAYTHVAMIAGIVVLSAGVKSVVAHPGVRAETTAAWNLAAGLAIYLLAEAWLRIVLGERRTVGTVLAVAVILAAIPLGTRVSGLAQLSATVALMVALIGWERFTRRPDGPRSHEHRQVQPRSQPPR